MFRPLAFAIVLVAIAAPASPLAAGDRATVDVLDDVVIGYRPDLEDPETTADGAVVSRHGQAVERTIDLPPAPAEERDAMRVVVTVNVRPITTRVEGRLRPNDPWTRLGNLVVVTTDESGRSVETEILRFTTAYGAAGTFRADVTPLAPLLHGRTTLRAYISTYGERPGWRLSANLEYTTEGVGVRRPAFAERVFFAPSVTSVANRLAFTVEIPPGLDAPRLRVISTGHSTDGAAGNEFVTCPHILRIDGREVARWRPWSERGGPLRDLNPWAGAGEIDGRLVRSSDFDRSGWHPGLAVEPFMIPLPELGPGTHRIELEIDGVRPKGPPDESGRRHHGYWIVSAVLVADAVWSPETNEPAGRTRSDDP